MKTVLLLSSVLTLAILYRGKIVQGRLMSPSMDGSGSGDDIDSLTPSKTDMTTSVSSAMSPTPTADSSTIRPSSSTITVISSTSAPLAITTILSPPTPSLTTAISSSFTPARSTMSITTTIAVSSSATTSIDLDILTSSMTAALSTLSLPLSSSPSLVSSSSFLGSTSIPTTSIIQVTTSNLLPSTMLHSSTPSSISMSSSTMSDGTTTTTPISSITSTNVVTLTPAFLTSLAVEASPTFSSILSQSITVSRSITVSQSPSPSVIAPPPPAGLPVLIIAGAAGGLCVVIVCVVCVVCLACCCVKKRGKFELLGSGEDGTTLARDYQLQTFNDGNSIVIKQNKDEETVTTDTFGIKSPPVQVDVGGQKFTFPDLPANGENLPALFFVNPVKPDEISSNTTFVSRSSTLPSRKKNKVLNGSDAVDIADLSSFSGQMKTSHSTSELNKDAHPALPAHLKVSSDQKTSPIPSPIYDTPRTFKPLASTDEKEKEKNVEALPTATNYVTMEPPPKKEPPLLTASQQPAPVEPINSAVVDRLAPKPSDAAIESIYDNARLIRPKPLIAEKTVPSQTNNTPSSIYDVPRKILVQADSSTTKEISSEKSVAPETVSKAVSTGNSEGVYDVPKINEKKENTKTTDTSNTQPLYSNVTSSSEDKPPLFPKQNQTANKPAEVEITVDSTKPLIPSKSTLTAATKVDIIEAAKKLKSASKEENSQTDSNNKPLILPKPNSVANLDVSSSDTPKNETQADGNTKPVLLPKPNAAKNPVSDTTKNETQTEGTSASAKPLILLKPKSSTTDAAPPPTSAKPKIFPKTNDKEKSASPHCESSDENHKETETSSSKKAVTVGLPPQKSPKPKVLPKKSDQEKSTSPQCESSDESRKDIEAPSSKTASTTDISNVPPKKSPKPKVLSRKSDQEKSASPQCESSDESRKETETSSDNGTPEPAGSGEDGNGFGAPKPRAKPRKATRKQVGLPQNLMQELFARQNSQSKLAEANSSPTKPLVKPKPNMK